MFFFSYNFDLVIYQRLDILVKDEKKCLIIEKVCAQLCNIAGEVKE
jgi:hypothetical protein